MDDTAPKTPKPYDPSEYRRELRHTSLPPPRPAYPPVQVLRIG